MKFSSAIFFQSVCAVLIATPAVGSTTNLYNYSTTSTGSWIDASLGRLEITEGGVIFNGIRFARTITRISSTYLTSTILPVSLPTWSSTIYYLALNSGDTIFLSGYGKASNVMDDSLSWNYSSHTAVGTNFASQIVFTTGTGFYTGASGYAETYGAYFPSPTNSTIGSRNWTTTTHLVLPSQVPELPSLTLFLLGVFAFAAGASAKKTYGPRHILSLRACVGGLR